MDGMDGMDGSLHPSESPAVDGKSPEADQAGLAVPGEASKRPGEMIQYASMTMSTNTLLNTVLNDAQCVS
jgi:hypothetical protein